MDEVLVNPSADRQILDFRLLGFDDVLVLGRYEYARAHATLENHRHSKMIEICLLESGKQVYVVEGKEHTLLGGDVFITYPGEVHGTGGHPEEKGVLFWLLIQTPGPHDRFLALPSSQGKLILDQLLHHTPRQFKGNAELKRLLNRIFKVHTNTDNPLRAADVQNLLLRFMLDMLTCARRLERSEPSEPIREIMTFIDAHLDEMIGLDVLADRINLSLSRFKMRFKKEVGIPPADYIMRRKVEYAKRLLESRRRSITDIAMKLGFSSSQYLATVFKRYIGCTPSEFRMRLQQRTNTDE